VKNMIKILIVDDDIGICKILQDFFEFKGYETCIASKGKEALDLAKKEKPHLVFLDIGLPDISGMEVLREIKKSDPTVKVIMITAYDEEERIKEAEKNGASDYVVKPFSLEYLNEITLRKVYKQLFEDLRTEHQELTNTYGQIVFTLARTLEEKDPYTKGHSERVSQYSLDIANELGLSENEKTIVSHAALLHNIGNMSLDDDILNKKHEFTNEEKEVVKKHCIVGYEILQILDNFQEHALIIRHHHERIDGNGYPDNKKGEEIPFLSRILTIADAYDAMTSKRPYREKISSPIEAVNELIKNKGIQFEPELVNAFINVLAKKQIIIKENIQ